MNTFTEPFRITTANPEDLDSIYQLFNCDKVRYFGEPKHKNRNRNEFFNKYVTYRFLIQIGETSAIPIGYAEMSNAPYMPALPEDCWENWLNRHYCTQLPLSRGNTFFFNSFVYNTLYNPPALLRQVLCELFHRENKIRYIIVVQCPEYGIKYEKGFLHFVLKYRCFLWIR